MSYSDLLGLPGAAFGLVAGTSLALTALKASVIMGLGWLIVLALHNASAATRHLVWSLTFAAVLILPAASLLMPNWSILPGGAWFNAGQPSVAVQAAGASQTVATSPAQGRAASSAGIVAQVPAPSAGQSSRPSIGQPVRTQSPTRDAAEPTVAAGASIPSQGQARSGEQAGVTTSVVGGGVAGSAGVGASVAGRGESGAGDRAVDTEGGLGAAAGQPAPLPGGPTTGISQLPASNLPFPGTGAVGLILILWATGVAVRLGILWLGVGRISWLARRARPLDNAKVQAEADAAAADLGLTRTPQVLIGEDAPVPMTWGMVSPRILLPTQAHSWSLQRLRRVLLHETAHIARRDLLAQWIGEIACAVHWFNPLVWTAAARMRMEREHASDDLVLSHGVRASDYAGDLLEIVRGFEVPPVLAGAAGMARPSQLGERLRAVLDPSRPRGPVGGSVRAIAFGVGAIILMGAASISPSTAEAASDPGDSESADAAGSMGPNAMGAAGATSTANVTYATDIGGAGRAGEPSDHGVGPGIAVSASREGTLSGEGTLPTSILTSLFDSDAEMEAFRAAARRAEICPYPQEGEDHDPEYGVLTTSGGGQMRGTMRNTSDENGQIELAWTGRACTVRVTMPQATRFNDAETDLASIPGGGQFEVVFRSREMTRRLVVTANMQRQYSVNGNSASWDAEAQAWMADLVVTIFRRMSYQAQERATRIYRASGLRGLMQEISLLSANFVRGDYIATGFGLVGSDDERRELLDVAGETMDGDYALGKVLVSAAESHTMSEPLRRDFIRIAGQLEGDYEMARVFAALLEHQEVGRDRLFEIMAQARSNIDGDYELSRLYRMLLEDPDVDIAMARQLVASAGEHLDGDYEKSRILRAVAEREDLGPGVISEVMDAFQYLDGDHQKTQILKDFASVAASSADLVRVLSGMDRIEGDHGKGEVLEVILRSDHFDGRVFDSVLAVLEPVGGFETRQILSQLIAEQDLTDGQVVALISVAGRQGGHDATQILTDIARTGRVEGDVRDAYLAAAENFGDHDQDRILAALVRRGGGER